MGRRRNFLHGYPYIVWEIITETGSFMFIFILYTIPADQWMNPLGKRNQFLSLGVQDSLSGFKQRLKLPGRRQEPQPEAGSYPCFLLK